MGFSVSASYVLLGIGLLGALTLAWGAATNATDRFSEASRAVQADALEQSSTDIALTIVEYNGSHLLFSVENRGRTDLSVDGTDVLVDGTYVEGSLTTSVDGDRNTGIWGPGQTLSGSVESTSPQRLKLVTEHGVAVSTSVTLFRQSGQVAFTNTSDLRSVDPGTSLTDTYSGIGQSIGPVVVNFRDDDVLELPAVESDNDLVVATSAGGQTVLADDAKASGSRLAVGTWFGSDPSVFYANDSTGDIQRVTATGNVRSVVSASADGIGGFGDIDGDGEAELIYGGTSSSGNSDTVNFLDDDGTTLIGTGQGYGTSGGIGLGEPADFDDDGTARVPIVDGSNNVALVDATGATTTLTTGGPAAKAPLATFDTDGGTDEEIVFVDTGGTLQVVDDVTGSNTVSTVTDGNGDPVTADTDAGAA